MEAFWTPWKIRHSPTTDLDKRVEELIQLRKTLQAEIDFIYEEVEQRIKNGPPTPERLLLFPDEGGIPLSQWNGTNHLPKYPKKVVDSDTRS
jgi:hypothetical protein